MDKRLPYVLLVLLMLALNGFIFLTPYLASKGSAEAPLLYAVFAPTCHQLTSRSLCLFVEKGSGKYGIGDCYPSEKLVLSHENEVDYPDGTGYKLPVCARDVAIYLAMLAGLLALPFFQKMESEDFPDKWLLVAAAVPIAIDGFTQLFGLRESSNLLRIATGVIIGVVLPFYLLPVVNMLASAVEETLAKMKKKGKRK